MSKKRRFPGEKVIPPDKPNKHPQWDSEAAGKKWRHLEQQFLEELEKEITWAEFHRRGYTQTWGGDKEDERERVRVLISRDVEYARARLIKHKIEFLRTANRHSGEVSKAQPPPNAEKLLHLFLSKEQREYQIGDLEEEFRTYYVPVYGIRFARIWYWNQVFASVVPVVSKRIATFARIGKTAAWLWSKFGS